MPKVIYDYYEDRMKALRAYEGAKDAFSKA